VEDNFASLRRKDDGSAVKLANPATVEFQVGRNFVCLSLLSNNANFLQVGRVNLLSGALKTLNSNAAHPLPIRVFEISDVMLQDAKSDVGAINRRRLCALYSNTSAGFEVAPPRGNFEYINRGTSLLGHSRSAR